MSVWSVDASATQHDGDSPRIRFSNDRIGDVIRYAMKKSPSFEDLVFTLESLDRVIHIEEGNCRSSQVTACLQPLATPGGRRMQIRIDPRQPIKIVAAHLAHELYHASEIARDPLARDPASIRALYQRIGYRSCAGDSDHCWETRAAVAFEALVIEQLNGHSYR